MPDTDPNSKYLNRNQPNTTDSISNLLLVIIHFEVTEMSFELCMYLYIPIPQIVECDVSSAKVITSIPRVKKNNNQRLTTI